MLRAGDVRFDPSSGRRLIVRRTARQTAERLVEYAVQFGLNEPRPAQQADVDREHLVEVVHGQLLASVSGRLQRLGEGDVLLITCGQAHAIWNASDSPAAAVWQTFPALDTETLLEARWQPQAQDGHLGLRP